MNYYCNYYCNNYLVIIQSNNYLVIIQSNNYAATKSKTNLGNNYETYQCYRISIYA